MRYYIFPNDAKTFTSCNLSHPAIVIPFFAEEEKLFINILTIYVVNCSDLPKYGSSMLIVGISFMQYIVQLRVSGNILQKSSFIP